MSLADGLLLVFASPFKKEIDDMNIHRVEEREQRYLLAQRVYALECRDLPKKESAR